MFESISNFFGNVKRFFTDTIPDTISGAFNKGKEVVGGVIDTGKNVVKTLHDDVVGVAKGYRDTIQGAIGSAKDVITHGEDTIGNTLSNLGNSLSLPLVAGVAVVGLVLLRK